MAKRRSFLWQFYPALLVLLFAFAAFIYFVISSSLYQQYLEQKKEDLRTQASFLQFDIDSLLDAQTDFADLDPLCKTLSRQTRTRITLISTDGRVLGDSDQDPSAMENHLSRPEVQQALQGQTGLDIRASSTLKERYLYAAVPLFKDGRVALIIRTAFPIRQIEETLTRVQHKLLLSTLPAAGLMALLLWLLCWHLTKPLRQIAAGAKQFASGNLTYRLPLFKTREVAFLAKALNHMASELAERIETITLQRNEQQAVLASMNEGVLALDLQNRCISMNNAARCLLQVSVPNPAGRTANEMVRNTQFQEFIRRALADPEPLEERLTLREADQERYVHLRSSALIDHSGRRIGTLIVLRDITDLHKLQRVKTDFVANVSHELKTPVTSIKGFLETLLEGAKDNPEDLKRFLEIMRRQTDRLDSIIEDLLTLSSLEQQTEQAPIPRQRTALRPLLEEAADCCRHSAQNKQIPLTIDCPEDLTALLNPSLFIQAIVNLLDNAVKYSQPERPVRIRACREGQMVRIEVQDEGCGIAREHLPRIFERFYRADKARSRSLGGTGLGLAIVKHIMAAHNGSVQVNSTLGIGSTFTLLFPADE
ncbi:MAG TPA: ATP-binding protein [Anaerohalosphaeraceae bacterium]|nr:ATP-binding protein [Anaerohalosphaeraceae bacterium]HQG06133.1 ATP-binding protein [Anaerohalosphaeraceae bacterium]HQI06577.1 ATP-binding protein [Anaerohalosphaeraceae bacterium]HQJ68018.1 ATP-binding protein [Anaerohalosphaeraceae bacterium]